MTSPYYAVPMDIDTTPTADDLDWYITEALPDLDDDTREAEQHQDPIPGHFHYLDRGYW